MSKKTDFVTITVEDFEELQDRSLWLMALEAAGVDNWSGIDYAHEIYSGWVDEKEEENEGPQETDASTS